MSQPGDARLAFFNSKRDIPCDEPAGPPDYPSFLKTQSERAAMTSCSVKGTIFQGKSQLGGWN